MNNFELFYEQKINSLEQLEEVYRKLLPKLKKKSLLLLIGPAGAGKTTSVQLLTGLMGISSVASPSFGIHHHYQNSAGKSFDHVDLYRLEDGDDLESTGFWDLFSQPEAIVAVEWADRLDLEMLPLNWQQVRITLGTFADAQERSLKIEIRR